MADKNFRVKNGLEVGGTEIDIAQGTTIEYSENNNRANRPVVQSTTGNTSGLRVEAPNATTSAVSVISAFSTNDGDNGKFLSIQARGDLTTPLRIQSGQYTAGVLSATTDLVNFVDGGVVYATVNPNGIINNTDLTTKLYVDSLVDEDTKYTIDASSTTGGANFNLVGSDLTTDTVKFSSGGATTVSQVNSNEIEILSVNTTYTQNASVESGGAGLNLVGSDSTTDTVKFAEGTGIDIVATDANTITTTLNATLDDLSNVDNTTTALAAGQMFYYNGTNWVNSVNVDSPNLNRFLRTNTGTGNNAILAISRNRTDDVRAVDGGPWLGFEYVGTDNTQATGPQNAIRSRYQTSGNHQFQFLQNPGNYTSPVIIGQMQRGAHFLNSTTGYNILNLSDTASATRANTITLSNSANTSTYASFAGVTGTINQDVFTIKNTAATTTYASFVAGGATITGTGLSQITRTTVGTPGSPEQRPAFNIQLSRSDQAAPNYMDGTSFRYRVNGSNNTNYTIADLSTQYATSGDVMWALNLANGDQTGATFSSVSTFNSKISATSISAGTASATPGASTVAPVATFTPTNNTLKADALTLQDYAGVALVGSAVSYNRVYGQWEQDGPVTPVAANTSYVFPIGTAIDTNIASVVSTSRITPGAAGKYNLQFSLQWANADNSEHNFYVWLRKNGVNVANSTGEVTCLKSAKGVNGWNYIISSANTTDYFELAYQVTDTDVTFPYVATFGTAPNDVPSAPALITTLTPVGA